jgi:hypothetical protein
MEAKIYNLDEYRTRKTEAIKKEKGKNMANHPSRRVDRQSTLDKVINKIGDSVGFPRTSVLFTDSESKISQDTDPTPPQGIKRPVEMYDQDKETPQFYDQDKD